MQHQINLQDVEEVVIGKTYVLIEDNVNNFEFNCDFRYLFFLTVDDFILKNAETKPNGRDLILTYENKTYSIVIKSNTMDSKMIILFSITEKDNTEQPNIDLYKTILRKFRINFFEKFFSIKEKACESCIYGSSYKLISICKNIYTPKGFDF